MKKILTVLVFSILFTSALQAQWEIRGSLGLNMTAMSDVRDYVNEFARAAGEDVKTFNASVEFGCELGYQINEHYQIGLEVGYEYNSFSYPGLVSQYELTYRVLMPSIIGYYILPGKGYKIKFGAGIGPRLVATSEKIYTIDPGDNTSFGFGALLKTEAATAIGEASYAYIGGDLRYNINGEPFEDGNGEGISFNALSAGVKLGVMFMF